MTKIKDGGPAFPVTNDANVNEQEGMTLRDYFAAKAMQGFCTHGGSRPISQEVLAEYAYQMADAMLAERERGE